MSIIAIALLLLFLPPMAAAQEQVVYATSTGAKRMPPMLTHTEVYAIDPDTQSPRLLFSDRDSTVLLLPAVTPGAFGDPMLASGGRRVFARGVERSQYHGGWHTFPAAVYELSTDRSGTLRKLFDVPARDGTTNFRNLFASPAGEKIGYLNYLGKDYLLSIHDSATGKLLHRIDLRPIALDCFVQNIGWLPDGKRLFFTLATGDEHVTSDASYARAGSYVMNEDGSGVVRLPRDISAAARRAGFRSDPEMWPVLDGRLPDGRYVFHEAQWQGGPRYEARLFFYAVDPASKARTDLTGPRGTVTRALLSPSGRRLLFCESQGSTQPESVWLVDTGTRNLQQILAEPAPAVSRVVAGWISE